MANLITVADAAALLKTSQETIRRYVRRGELKAYTKRGQGRRLFIEKSMVEKFAEFAPLKRSSNK